MPINSAWCSFNFNRQQQRQEQKMEKATSTSSHFSMQRDKGQIGYVRHIQNLCLNRNNFTDGNCCLFRYQLQVHCRASANWPAVVSQILRVDLNISQMQSLPWRFGQLGFLLINYSSLILIICLASHHYRIIMIFNWLRRKETRPKKWLSNSFLPKSPPF